MNSTTESYRYERTPTRQDETNIHAQPNKQVSILERSTHHIFLCAIVIRRAFLWLAVFSMLRGLEEKQRQWSMDAVHAIPDRVIWGWNVL